MSSFTFRRGAFAALVLAAAACSGGGSDPKPAPECSVAADCAAPGVCKATACVGGACVVSAAATGASCGSGLRCDATGTCVECLSATDCPGSDTMCSTRTCSSGTCGLQLVAAGTAIAAQTAGDCHEDRCDGAGSVTSAVDDADVPDDGNDCTSDTCSSGNPVHTPVATETSCAAGVCNALGQCVGCVVASDCPGSDGPCSTRRCEAGVCGFAYAAGGTSTPTQVGGDCHKNVCDGVGHVVSTVDDFDVPLDANACTNDVCASGVPTHPAATAGTPCASGGGTVCNGAYACVECISGDQCTSGVCSGNVCQAPSCNDNVKNGAETNVDCGGPTCAKCAVGKTCAVNSDCATASCVNQTCAPECHPVVNEVQASVGAAWDDWIEIYSGCGTSVDVSGWRLSYFPFGAWNSEYVEYTFGSGAAFAPGTYLLFANSFYSGATDGLLAWGLNAYGVAALLDATGRIVDAVAWGSASGPEGSGAPAPGAGQSIGRKPNGVDTNNNAADFVIYATPTPRAQNP